VLSRHAGRLLSLLVPRVRAAWPAIGAIALAVVLAHSGVLHLNSTADLASHYRAAIGTDEWTRAIGILQLLAAGGLCFRRTRVMTAAGFAAVLLVGVGNQLATQRIGAITTNSLLLFVWTIVIAWGEMRRAGPPAGL
jgi:hypothetical protein